jgi:hypothetical protein
MTVQMNIYILCNAMHPSTTPPHKTAEVATAVDKVDTFEFPEDNPDPFHKLDTPSTRLVPLVLMIDDNNDNLVKDKEASHIKATVLGSTVIDGLRCST